MYITDESVDKYQSAHCTRLNKETQTLRCTLSGLRRGFGFILVM